MNNVFDVKRFGRYVRYDMGNLKSQYGIAILVMMLAPLIYYIGAIAFGLGLYEKWDAPDLSTRIGIEVMLGALFYITMPAKLYGDLTGKRHGSDWLMIPASAFEKFLSCMVICLVVAPLIFMTGYYVCDGILSVVDPTYGKALIVSHLQSDFDFLPLLKLNGFFVTYFSYACSVLTFLLGALVFKRYKAGFTILALMIVGFVFSLIIILLATKASLSWVVDVSNEMAEFWFNFILDAFLVLYIAVIAGCIYLRMKHLKH